MFWKPARFFACLFLLAVVGPALTQPAAVAVKPPIDLNLASKTPLLNWYEKRDGKMVCTGTLNLLVVTALEEEADYYRVRWLGRQGWVKRDDVVTLSQALAYIKGRVERDPLDGYAHCLYASKLMGTYQSAPAQIEVDKAVRLLPNDSRPRQLRAVLCFLNGDAKGALDDLNVAIRLDPSNSQIYMQRACVLWSLQRRYEEALLDLDKVFRLSPNYEGLYTTRAEIWTQKGNYRKAVADLDLAIQAYPDFLDAHVDRAELLSDLIAPAVYNLPEAIVSARRACELTKWEDGTHLRRLAHLYERAGDKEEAARCREKAERVISAQLPPLPAAKP